MVESSGVTERTQEFQLRWKRENSAVTRAWIYHKHSSSRYLPSLSEGWDVHLVLGTGQEDPCLFSAAWNMPALPPELLHSSDQLLLWEASRLWYLLNKIKISTFPKEDGSSLPLSLELDREAVLPTLISSSHLAIFFFSFSLLCWSAT